MPRLHLFLLALIVIAEVVDCEDEGPRLIILPEGVVMNSIDESVYVQCTAKVENEDLVSQMEWRGPGVDSLIPNADLSGRRTSMPGFEKNQLDLYMKALRPEDVGIYNCTALYAGNQRMMESVEIISFKNIDFQDTETVQTPVRGTDAKIRCAVTSDPPPMVDWLKDGAKFNGDKRHIIQTDGILIKNISIADEGVYRCRVRVPSVGKIAFRDIQVEVHELPVITLAPKDTDGVEKEAVSFECIAKAKPPPSYSWVNNENEVLNEKDGYFVDDISGELRIMDLRPDHSGTYRCTATNPAGEITAEANLRVLTKPTLEHYENVTIGLNDDAVLKCTFSGDPLPNVVFKKETNQESFVDNVNEDLRIDVQQSQDTRGNRVGTMKIESVMRKDDGLYSCSGVSTGGETVVWGHITVEFPPTFEDQPQDEFWSWEQQPVNLTCLATSIPNATVQWYIRNDPIRLKDPNYHVTNAGPNGVLQVTPLDGSYFDTYTCQATNTIGTTDHDVFLKQVQKPGPVSSTQVEKTTATTVQWTIRDPLNDGGRPVLGYTVLFRLEDQSWDKAESHFWSKGSTYIIDKLVPKNSYMFKFAAKNDVGDGEWSGEKNVVMPKEAEPEEPLIYSNEPNEVKSIPYPDHYDLQWKVPLDNGESIDHFLITYFKVTNATKGREFKAVGKQEEITVPHPGQSTYKLEDLQSNTIYKIELRAHNKIGNSRPAVALIKTTRAQSSPAAPPSKGSESGNSGSIAGIVILVLILVLVVIDAILYFARDVGVIATLFRKCSQTGKAEKDKEAMLVAVTASSDKSDSGVNGKAAKEPQIETKEEKEPEKEKEVVEKEPTESTPMIEGESDKEAIEKEEKEEKSADNPLAKSESQATITKDSAV